MARKNAIPKAWIKLIDKFTALYAKSEYSELQNRVVAYYREREKTVHSVLFYGFSVDGGLMFSVTLEGEAQKYVNFDKRDLGLVLSA